jgi:phage tail sheath protein FI
MPTQNLTVESTLPGVYALVNQFQVARPVQRQPSSTAYAVGYATWGPADQPTVCTSWPDYVRKFGGLNANSFLSMFAYIFFNVFPGKTLVVVRVVGTSPVVHTLTIQSAGGSPVGVWRLDSKYAPNPAVDILATVTLPGDGTFTLKLRSVYLNRTEIFEKLANDAASIEYVTNQSTLVTPANLNAVGAPLPAALVETAMASGDDKFSTINAARYIGTDDGAGTKTGLQALKDSTLGTGQVAIPGMTTTAVHQAIIAHAEAYHRTGLLDPAFGSTPAAVLTERALLSSSYCALYYPWVQMPDLAGSGNLRFYPPSAFAAGACAQVDRTIGTHKAPANVMVPGAVDVERYTSGAPVIDDNTHELLNGKSVNVIRAFGDGQGVKIYGARTLASDTRIQMVHEARLMNLFYYSAKTAYSFAPFAVVDGQGRLFRDLRAVGRAFLRDFWQSGALFGKREEDAYVVIADETNNPPEELDLGRVHVTWGVRLSPTAEIIFVNIENVRLTQSLTVLTQ